MILAVIGALVYGTVCGWLARGQHDRQIIEDATEEWLKGVVNDGETRIDRGNRAKVR